MLGDWLVVNQVLPVNPAAAVRGPKHVVTKGATPVLSPAKVSPRLTQAETMRAIRAQREPQRVIPTPNMDPRRDRGPFEFHICPDTMEAVR